MPPDKTKIWRFTDFHKFYSMLLTESLHFSRLDRLEDQFEGHYSRGTLEFFQKAHDDPDAESILYLIKILVDPIRKKAFVNCWHMNDYESDLLWHRYSSMSGGVAIASTAKRLRDCFQKEVYIGEVEYFDLKHVMPYDNPLRRVVFKLKEYQDEHELRAIIPYESDKKFTGLQVKVNLHDLIESVYISPKSQKWFKKLVKSTIKKFGLNIPVNESIFSQKPFVPRFMKRNLTD